MRTTLISTLFLTLLGSAIAGENCKCQDPSGSGPQWNDATSVCCQGDQASQSSCFEYGMGKNNQCSAKSINCINSGLFDKCCKKQGDLSVAPGAFCWT
ncbi:hypothetical protein CLAFUW4_07758 [Fulvia fulva]|uniref:Uncharacterized protein n=1 Tax=Passalora fulva TaxID=5499 RepID=A0A9Q8P6J4_PASFU|nr:uncharacterized protein CLAFUR5_07884 [Fulvia fulva]KAK4629056.1 hypothetical protein CLAFUR4_07763 [Fulvia fulva]KAK4630105.1 hypothetical protein CLAFUR0_07761 [Fulvia fulva]UJO15210.1 hypothetical protein CLAFUR5_07884 [Fulvia fulva]WPV12453.1 hypothetical protein CLAFUW4_07758 [Fulvia fulva]WPV27543.1 hypothetical protein CLAFUW7_07759 [Fulvia fulva]